MIACSGSLSAAGALFVACVDVEDSKYVSFVVERILTLAAYSTIRTQCTKSFQRLVSSRRLDGHHAGIHVSISGLDVVGLS